MRNLKISARRMKYNSVIAVIIAHLVSMSTSSVSSAEILEHFSRVVTTSEISFAHLRADANDSLSPGWWTKEQRCSPGSFIADYRFCHGPDGTILAIAALCEDNVARKINIIDVSTTRQVSRDCWQVPDTPANGDFAVAFIVQSWVNSVQDLAVIGERKFNFNLKDEKPPCPEATYSCNHKEYICAKGARICGLQAKVHGGRGAKGGIHKNSQELYVKSSHYSVFYLFFCRVDYSSEVPLLLLRLPAADYRGNFVEK